MKLYRRIFGDIDNKSKKLAIEDIFQRTLDWGYFTQDLEEQSITYSKIRKVIDDYDLSDSILGAEFTKEEINDADILYLKGLTPFAYPEPQMPQFLNNTFTDVCLECGVYGKQKADFVIKKNSKLTPDKLGMLHWIYSEIFCGNVLYSSFFEQKAINKRAIQDLKLHTPIIDQVQLILPTLNFSLNMDSIESTCCDKCKRVKYTPSITGFFPLPKEQKFDIIKTKEVFGTGHNASQRIFVSNKMMKEMLKLKIVKPYQFVPCK